MTEKISVEVAYALAEKQKIVALEVDIGCSAREAARLSKLDQDFDGLDLNTAPLGIFGSALGARGLAPAEEYQLKPGDRVEIYRPLVADPKEVRRQRAAGAKQSKSEK